MLQKMENAKFLRKEILKISFNKNLMMKFRKEKRKNILGIRVNAVDYSNTCDCVFNSAKEKSPFSLAAVPVHSIMTAFFNPEFRYRLNQMDLVVPDGQPVRWAMNIIYRAGLKDRVYGPTLMLKILEKAEEIGLSVYFYGNDDEVLGKLKNRLLHRFPDLKIAGMQPGKYRQLSIDENNEMLDHIRKSGAKILFIGLGCPKQEIFAYENREKLSIPIIPVGAAFDFHAGNKPQAPRWMQKAGLEWFFRLLKEPLRLWKRYIFYNPLYIVLIILQKFGLIIFDPEMDPEPVEEFRWG